MTTLLLLLLASGLVLLLLDGNWRDGLVLSVLVGFLQDPIRKLAPGQPSLYVGLVLIAVVCCAVVLLNQRHGLDLEAMFWGAPQLRRWLPLYAALIVLQGLNGLLRFHEPLLTLIGVGFYLAPALGLWLGFQVGCDQVLLRRIVQFYLLVSVVYGFTVWLSYSGFDYAVLKEVGPGILIHFRRGFSVQGASGLWRSSEVAAWHLSAAACLAISLAFASEKPSTSSGLTVLALVFTLLTLLTGRRKALVLVVVFVLIYGLLFRRYASPHWRERLFTTIFAATGVSYATYSLFGGEVLGTQFSEYLHRANSASSDILSRFNELGIGASLKAFEMSGLIGFGAGAASQTGVLAFGQSQIVGEHLAYVSEGGGGKIITELGPAGALMLLAAIGLLIQAMRRYLPLLRYLPATTANFLIGLLAFGLANTPFFLAASGVYGDPFVLLLLSLCLGSFLSIPILVAQGRRRLASEELRHSAPLLP
jgi:hypothetical protein